MGAWGTALYSNDFACDIRGEYVDALRRGKTNEEITQKLILDNESIMGDMDEEPLFWFALADTQWNYGRLMPEVKEKALFFLNIGYEDGRWTEQGEKKQQAWMNTLDKLRAKLLLSPPPEKKVYKYKLYQCQWKIGDVYAYRFNGEHSREKGFFGKYAAFRKIGEANLWPGHIIPVVHVYDWLGSKLPTLEELEACNLLAMRITSEKVYEAGFLTVSERVIPKNELVFLGNISGDDLVIDRLFQCYEYANLNWETQKNLNAPFERHFILMYSKYHQCYPEHGS